MSSPNEITEAVMKNRLKMAILADAGLTLEAETGIIAGIDKRVSEFFTAGKFADFVGVVKKAQDEERQKAVTICNRLGHRQTAQVIAKGSSDV